jgi:glycosyltransferase involved in cell wall biosynthesis
MDSFTVITVVKDNILGFERTFNSVAQQGHSDFQYLVLDGSIDGSSPQIESRVNNSGFASYQYRQPRGIYDAMNYAAGHAQENYILFLNAGDIFLRSDSAAIISALINTNNNLDIIATPVLYLTPNSYPYSLAIPHIEKSKYAIFHHQGVLVKTKKFHDVNGFNESLKFAADGELLDRVIQSGNCLISNEVLVGFEMGGASGSNFSKLIEEIGTYRELESVYLLKLRTFKNQLRTLLVNRNFFPTRLRNIYLLRRKKTLARANPNIDFNKFDLIR